MTINYDPIFDFIETAKIPDWDREPVAAAVLKAVEQWVEKDLATMEVVGQELRGEDPFPYVIDLLLRRKDGKMIVADWKTKKPGKLDARFVEREQRSWQSRIYGAAVATLYGREVFPLAYEVRGITLEDKPKTLTIPMAISEQDGIQAVRYLRQVSAMRESLVTYGKTPWVRDSAGCQCFGPLYKCEWEPVCWNGVPMPEGDMERASKGFSHSSAQEFLRCPERYRLGRIVEKPEVAEDSAAAGRAFHEAMELVYGQLKGDTK